MDTYFNYLLDLCFYIVICELMFLFQIKISLLSAFHVALLFFFGRLDAICIHVRIRHCPQKNVPGILQLSIRGAFFVQIVIDMELSHL